MEELSHEQFSYTLRQSIAVLITNLLVAEFLLGIVAFFLRFPIKLFAEGIDTIISSEILYLVINVITQIANMGIILFLTLQWTNLVYIIKPNEIIEQRGIIKITETVFATERIETTNISQGLWGRIWKFGSLNVFNPVLKADLVLENIPDPYLYAEIINNRQSKEVIRFLPKRR